MVDERRIEERRVEDGGSHAGIYILLVFIIALIIGGIWWFTSGETVDDGPDIELNLPEGSVEGEGSGSVDIEGGDGGG